MSTMSNNEASLDQPWSKTETSLEQQTNTSDDSTTTDSYGSERQSKRSMPRSLSVDNTPRVSVTNANNYKPHSLPSNLKSVKVKKHSNNKVYQYIVKTIGLTKSTAETGGLCRHIGNRYAHGSPELNCRANREAHSRQYEVESMLSILTLKPLQIAQELTRYQAEMLQAISPLELQKGAWTSKKKVNFQIRFTSCANTSSWRAFLDRTMRSNPNLWKMWRDSKRYSSRLEVIVRDINFWLSSNIFPSPW